MADLLSGLQAGDLIERERLAQQAQNQSGAARLFDQLLRTQAMKRQAQMDELTRQEAQQKMDAANLANATTVANLRQSAAGKTPIAEAPQASTGQEDVAFLNPDEAAFANVQPSATGTVDLGKFTVPDRSNPVQIPSGLGGGTVDIPLQFKEDVDAANQRAAELTALGKQRERPTVSLTPQDVATLGTGKAGDEMDLEEYGKRLTAATKGDGSLKPVFNRVTKKMDFASDDQIRQNPGQFEPIRTGVNVINQGAQGSPADIKTLADSMRAGNISAADLGRAGQRLAVVAQAARDEPGFTTQTYNQRMKLRNDFASSGPSSAGGQIDSLNQLAEHLEVLKQAADALKNKNLPAQNAVINYARQLTGDPSVNNMQTAQLAVAQEVSRLLKGGVAGEDEGKKWEARYNPNFSPDQQSGAVNTTRALVRGRLDAKRQKWNAVMGKSNVAGFDDYLTPASQRMFEEIQAPGAGTTTPGAGTTTPGVENWHRDANGKLVKG